MKLGDKMKQLSTSNVTLRVERARVLYNSNKDDFSEILEDIIESEAREGHSVIHKVNLMNRVWAKCKSKGIVIPEDLIMRRTIEACINAFLISENFFVDNSVIMWDNYDKVK